MPIPAHALRQTSVHTGPRSFGSRAKARHRPLSADAAFPLVGRSNIGFALPPRRLVTQVATKRPLDYSAGERWHSGASLTTNHAELASMPDIFEHAMTDLELVGLDYGRGILQVGVAFFNTSPGTSQEIEVHSLHPNVFERGNRSWCKETEAWWRQTDEALFEELLEKSRRGPKLGEVMEQFAELLLSRAPLRVWADYCAFDVAHMQFAMQRTRVRRPWTHRQIMSSNTTKDTCRLLFGTAPRAEDHPGRRAHDAGSDAWQQALDVQLYMQKLQTLIPSHLTAGEGRATVGLQPQGEPA